MDIYDLIVIGGGINGCSIAAEAATRGLGVALFEQNDLASGTSSYSSKLIHGGIRYLEQKAFRLVKHALAEREVWMARAPHLVKPLKLVLPLEQQQRAKWQIRIGLWLYDHLSSRNQLPASHLIKRQTDPLLNPINSEINSGFSYYDCICDDARLVIAIAKQAHQNGASIKSRHRVVKAVRDSLQRLWQIDIIDNTTGKQHRAYSHCLVNAAGPWMNEVSQNIIEHSKLYHCQLVKGSHIVVNKLYPGEHAYILQNIDKRIVFTIPYHNKFTLIGTTDVSHHTPPENARLEYDERNYLLNLIEHYFQKTLSTNDIINSFSGVRPLIAEAGKDISKVSRDYQVDLSCKNNLPLLTITGGKLTTARLVGKQAINKLKPYFNKIKPSVSASLPLPGGDFGELTVDTYCDQLKSQLHLLPKQLIERYCTLYGSNVSTLLGGATTIKDLGIHFGAGCYQIEVDYLVQHEWARTIDDILWRRTKLGLFLKPDQQQALNNYLESSLCGTH